MSILTPANVFRRYDVDGVPDSGPHYPKKAEVIQLLERMQQQGGAAVSRATLTQLQTVVPAAGTFPRGEVLSGAEAGWYAWSGTVWEFERGFPDTLARLTVLGGTADVVQTSAMPGVDPGEVLAFYIDVSTPNEGPVTVSINGGSALPALNINGDPFAVGEWSGRLFLSNEGDHLRALNDAAAAHSAADSAAEAAANLSTFKEGYLGRFVNDAAASAAAGTPIEGQLYWDITSKAFRYWDGDSWETIPFATVADGAITNAKLAGGAVTPDKLDPNEGIDFRQVIRAAERQVHCVRQTNRLAYGSLIRGGAGWASFAPSAARVAFAIDPDASDNPTLYFTRAKAQIDATAAGQTVQLANASAFAVDATKRHVVGFWAGGYGAVDPLPSSVSVKCYSDSGVLLGTLSIAKNVALTRTATGSQYIGLINAAGGSSPAWPSGTVSASALFGFVSTAVQGLHFLAGYVITEDEYPGDPTATTLQNAGGGTHEALRVGDFLYVLSHGFNQLVKFDANLKYVGRVATGDYPHDIVAIGNDLWVATHDAATLQRISIASFTVSNTYGITGSKNGFGLATDGARLWLGAGTNAQGCGLYEVNTTSGAMTLLSNDLNTVAANLPVQYLAGSVWTIHEGNSQVKRISPSGGATLATINCNIGKLYGLGVGDSYIWANGRNGVAKIDPATNTVVGRYFYRTLSSGQSNILVHKGFALACGEQGVMAINVETGEVRETLLDSGACKWVREMPNGEIAVGAYAAPWMFVLRT